MSRKDQATILAELEHEAGGGRQHVRNLTLGQVLQRFTQTDMRGLAAVSGLGGVIPSEGGFLIPTHVLPLVQKIYSDGEILRRCSTPEAHSTKVLTPYIHETSRADGSRFGGAQAEWLNEGEAFTASDLQAGLHTTDLKRLTVGIRASTELVEDYPEDFASVVTEVVTREMRFTLERAVVVGDGLKKPLGLLYSPAKIRVSKETNQTASTVWGVNISKMVARMWGPSFRRAVWLCSPHVLTELAKLVHLGYSGSATSDTDATPMFEWGGDTPDGWPRLCGRPVILCEYTPAVGSEGDIILVDLSQYQIPSKQSAAKSMHIYFASDEHCFRFVLRCDGQLTWSSALTPYNGGDTLSPVITLETRD
jgi:HK97 family phage major capsid protein